jgi:hypothetical protein
MPMTGAVAVLPGALAVRGAVPGSTGPCGDDPRALDAGTGRLGMADGPGNSADRDGARTVKARVRVGQHAGQIVLVERRFLRPRR